VVLLRKIVSQNHNLKTAATRRYTKLRIKLKMKNIIMVSSIFLMFGCAQMVPARSTEIGAGKYKLEASGNAFASMPSLIEKIDQKAIKLCGVGKYEYADNGDFSTPHSPAYVNGVDIGASYKVLTRVLICK
jgi:hypothetical protein